MIGKFFKHGKGSGGSAVNYLTKEGPHPRPDATVLRGDPQRTIKLINSLKTENRYTSGVLSFEESMSADDINQIIDSFETVLMPSMEKRVAPLWVQHQDHDRTELHFVIPKVDLDTGKSFQPYYHAADMKRVNDWKNLVNHDFKLSDPSAPERKRTSSFSRALPREKFEAVQMINNAMEQQISAGIITNRQDMVEALKKAGFEIAREVKSSISIKGPDGGKNIRLTGEIYAKDFRFSEETGARIEASQREYAANTGQRISETRERLGRFVEDKRQFNQEKYGASDAYDLAASRGLGFDSLRRPDVDERLPVERIDEHEPEVSRSEGPVGEPADGDNVAHAEGRERSNTNEQNDGNNGVQQPEAMFADLLKKLEEEQDRGPSHRM